MMTEKMDDASNDTTEALVDRILTLDAPNIRRQFISAIGGSFAEFKGAMADALRASHAFDKYAEGNNDYEWIALLIFGAVQGHLVAMRLFLDGFMIYSGNAQRQVLESIAMAVLCSKPKLGYLERFRNDEFTANKAIRDLLRNSVELHLNKGALDEFKSGWEFYHDFSHPSKMTIVLNQSLSEPDKTYIGGLYDSAKLKQYQMEAKSRVKLAKIIPGFVAGVRANLES
jgi:hypothetical protein